MKTEAELDCASRPMRDAIQQWARGRGLGFSGGWWPPCWRYVMCWDGEELRVEIAEDGGEARVSLGDFRAIARTSLGLQRALTRLTAK